jgi:hypothetical protein
MAKAKLNLTKRLHKIEHRKIKKLAIILSITIIMAVSSWGIYSLLPWSMQIFIRWIFCGGNVYQIPDKLHEDIDELCSKKADHQGFIKGREYKKNREIADGLGDFQCTAINGGQEWLIRDRVAFQSSEEASVGTVLAVWIVSILGTDYSYNIEAKIPNINLTNLPIIYPKPHPNKTPPNYPNLNERDWLIIKPKPRPTQAPPN